MRAWFPLALCACGFDLRVTIGMDRSYGSILQDGKPVPYVVLERSFDSVATAMRASIPFEVEDGSGSGLHSFELTDYINCDEDADGLELGLILTYSATCLPLPPSTGDRLVMCWSGSRCYSGSREIVKVP